MKAVLRQAAPALPYLNGAPCGVVTRPPAASNTACPAAVSHSMVRAEARIDIRLPFRNEAEFQRGADRAQSSDGQAGQEGLGGGIAMRTAGDGNEPALGRPPHANLLCLLVLRTARARTHAERARPQPAERGREHDAGNRGAVFDQRDVDREFAVTRDELARAIERIDQHEGARRRRLGARHILLGDHRQVGAGGSEAGHDGIVRGKVCLGQRGSIGLRVGLRGAVEGHDPRARILRDGGKTIGEAGAIRRAGHGRNNTCGAFMR